MVLVILGLAIALAGCEKQEATGIPKVAVNPAPAKSSIVAGAGATDVHLQFDKTPKIVLSQKDISLEWLDKGKLKMRAKAKEFRGSEVTKMGELIQFSAQLYENGVVTATISSPKATADTVKRTVTAIGGVKMKSLQRNTSLTSDRIIWYANKNEVAGQGNVVIDSTMGRITAANFEADTGLHKFSVSGSSGSGIRR